MRVNCAALRAIRERSGLSQAQLATMTQTGRSHLANIEAGRRTASPALVLRLAEALKVPVVAIMADPDGRTAMAPGD